MYRSQVTIAAIWVLVTVLGCWPQAFGQAGRTRRGVQDASASTSAVSSGRYYALVIGNNNYRNAQKLNTAVHDANSMGELLRDRYGFSVRFLLNATRSQILTALNELRRTLDPDSNLLIYYAGHGYHDKDAERAYWLPVDAQLDNNQNWISADDITANIRAMPSRHVLVISDSCYSGVLTRDADAGIDPLERTAYLAKMVKSRSRTLMSSGGDEPVADAGPEGHSVFANAVLHGLRQAEGEWFTAGDLFQRYIQPRVAGRSDQLPQYSLIRNSGHDYGDFVFSRNGKGLGVVSTGPGGDTITTGRSSAELDRDAISDVLQAYEDAYNRLDAAALWVIWPNPPTKTKQAIESAFKSANSIKMTLRPGAPQIASDGFSATVAGQFSQLFTPKQGDPQPIREGTINFSLQKNKTTGTWTIVVVK